MAEPTDLVGTFVVEVGERQAWPFVTFADNDQDREYRLFLDAAWSTTPDESHHDFDPALLELQGATVTTVAVGDDASLRIEFDGAALHVSGQPDEITTGDVWWIADVR
jgi:hypothetical protein